MAVTRRLDVVVGVDIGGTSVEAVAVDGSRTMLSRGSAPTDTASGASVVASAADVVGRTMRDLGPTARILALGVGVPGHVDGELGSVRRAVNLNIDEDGLAIGPLLEEAVGAPAVVENDARTAALGAYDHLAETRPGLRYLAYLGIGTGISAGFVEDGILHRGRDGAAGEIGHVVVDEDGPPCRCGLRGCLEAVAAGPAIARRWPVSNEPAARALFAAAAAGDPRAVPVAREVAGHLTAAVSWLVAAHGADLVVLGGGVGSIGDPLLSLIRERLAARAERSEVARRMVPPDRVVAMPAGFPTGAMGAASLARMLAGRGTGESNRGMARRAAEGGAV